MVFAVVAAADDSTAKIFKNFTYPFAKSAGWPDRLVWLKTDDPKKVKLVDGKWREPDSVNQEPFSGLTLEQVEVGDVTGGGQRDAIVVLRYDTGGTQYSYYVYIYRLQQNHPVLLARFRSGDRSTLGLYRVYPEHGELVMELFDPNKAMGDCCSTGFVKRRFKWTNSRFEQIGHSEFGTPKSSSRIPVDIRQPPLELIGQRTTFRRGLNVELN